MERIVLPIKTKIAVWWMIIFGTIFLASLILILIFIFQEIFYSPDGISTAIALGFYILLIIPFLLIGSSFLTAGLFLLKRKKWAWKFAIVLLLVATIFSSNLGVYLVWFGTSPPLRTFGHIIFLGVILGFIFVFNLVPIFLLIADKKNFWKIAT